MNKIKIGGTDLVTFPIAFGGNVFGWTMDEKQSFEILDAYADAGFNLIDTANTYSHWVPGNRGGESETILGNWMERRKNREKILITTKVGGRGYGRPKPDASKKHILEQADESLKRLKTNYIDLYLLHYDDGQTPPEETLSAFEELLKNGKVLNIGVSNISPERLRKTMNIAESENFPNYKILQTLYNLYDKEEFEKDYQPIVEENNLGVMSYYSLASGFLTGKYRTEADLNKSQRGKDVKKYLNERGMRILKTLDEVAKEYHTSQAVISLAWLLHKPAVTVPVVSATNLKQLESIVKAPQIRLNAETMEKLDKASEYS